MATLQPHVPSGRRNSFVPDKGRQASNVQDNPPETIPTQSEIGNRSRKSRRKFILCFDGTGNKFSGTDSDSNILKIYRMLDRDDSSQFHYYQPGIGTYVATSTFSHPSTFDKFKSWYVFDAIVSNQAKTHRICVGMPKQKILPLARPLMSM